MFSARMKKKGICGPNNALTHKSSRGATKLILVRRVVSQVGYPPRLHRDGHNGIAPSARQFGCSACSSVPATRKNP
eukprot:1144678-Pelagomonas_calceolata.AAC.3